MSDFQLGLFLKRQKSFLLYLLVGFGNTLFGYGVYAILIWLNLHYAAAALIATCLGVVFNFHTTGRLVFNNKNPQLLLKFIMVYVVLYLINVLILKYLIEYGVGAYYAGLINILPMAYLAYVLNKKFVFPEVTS